MTIIDRFEGNTAVLETDGHSADIPRSRLPQSALPGDVLVLEDGEYRIDTAATSERRRIVHGKLKKLLEREK